MELHESCKENLLVASAKAALFASTATCVSTVRKVTSLHTGQSLRMTSTRKDRDSSQGSRSGTAKGYGAAEVDPFQTIDLD